jgi:dUTP pyrophosphatase
MEIHPDERARIKQLEESRGTLSLPSSIKPWNGHPVPVKRLDPTAVLPTKANSTDAGYDLYSIEDCEIGPVNQRLVKTGISMAIPKGCVGLIWPRSGLAYKHGLDTFAGVIDAGYRGELGVILYNSKVNQHYKVKKGERIAQILFQKIEDFDLVEVENLKDSQRGAGGFGSSGS